MSYIRKGRKGGRIEADLSIDPLEAFGIERDFRNYTWLFVQYFDGYAETLLDYNRRSTSFRLGLRFAS